MTPAKPRRRARRDLARVVAGLGLLAVGSMAAAGASAFGWLGGPGGVLPVLGLLAVAVIGFVAIGFVLIDRHFDGLERLRAALLVAAGREEPPGEDWPPPDPAVGREVELLGAAAGGAIRAHRQLAGNPDQKLSAVVGAAAEGLVVITDSGLVSLVNAAARMVLGRGVAAVGTSIYATLDRESMAAVEAEVRRSGAACETGLKLLDGGVIDAVVAPLPAHGGFVISLPRREAGHDGDVEHDLALHDDPPAIGIGEGESPEDWLLEDLPVLAFDSETTGLDVASDRIVSLAAVRAHGRRLYPRSRFDRLVRPGMPIPPASTAIHGITDTMVAGAPSFPEVFGELEDMMRGSVLLGHCIGFDLGILLAECERHGIAWRAPPALDTALLFAVLEGDEADPGLEQLAQRMGVTVEGRHTALGDALVAADLWLCALPLLADRGVRTYGEARRFCATVRPFVMRQRAAGWSPAAG